MTLTANTLRKIEAQETSTLKLASHGLSIRNGNDVKFFGSIAELKEAVAAIETENLYSIDVKFSTWMFLQITVEVSFLAQHELNQPIAAVKLARNINAFDTNYQRIDDAAKFKFWSNLHTTIQNKIDGLTDTEIQSLNKLAGEKISLFKVRAVKVATMKSKVFTNAWELVKSTGETIAVCLSKAWNLYRLRKRMSVEVVTLTYKKLDGTVRRAKATLQGVANLIKGTGRENKSTFNYYDIDAKAFRSFKIENLIAIF